MNVIFDYDDGGVGVKSKSLKSTENSPMTLVNNSS
jgi:hypothetical protein